MAHNDSRNLKTTSKIPNPIIRPFIHTTIQAFIQINHELYATMPTNINMYKCIKTRSDTSCWSGFKKKNLFSDPFGKQNSGSDWYRIFKIFKTILNDSLGFIHILNMLKF